MRTHRAGLGAALIFGLLAMFPAAAAAAVRRAPGGGQPTVADITGTILIHGCDAAPSEFMLRARPIPILDSFGLARNPVPARLATRMALISRGAAGPGSLAFRFEGLTVGLPYRLGIQVNSPGCGKLFFQAPDASLVLPGLTRSVTIDGYAVRSQLEILGQPAGGRTEAIWVGAENVDFTDPAAAVRDLRYQSNLPGITQAELQVSSEPFPMPGRRAADPCVTPPLVYSLSFALGRDAWTTIPGIDFNGILYRGRVGAASFRAVAPADAGVTPETLAQIEMGAPLYVRVMPVNADGQTVCRTDDAGVPAVVILARLHLERTAAPPPPPDPTLRLVYAAYAPPVVWVHPKWDETCYRVTRDHYVDPNAAVFAFGNDKFNQYDYWLWLRGGVTPGSTAPEGKRFCVLSGSHDDGWLDSFVSDIGSAVTGFVDALAQMVNYASYLWDSIKSEVVNVVADAISTIAACDDACKAALAFGLDTGLVAMGVPPSLPNFDELTSEGLDYLADEVAEQADLPPEVADLATGKAKEFVQNAVQKMKENQHVPGLPNWLAPEVGFDPAVLTLHVQGNGTPFSSPPFLIRNANDLFVGSTPTHLPATLPETPHDLAVPMVLEPDLSGLPTPPGWQALWTTIPFSDYQVAIWNKLQWTSLRLTGACVTFDVTALVPGDIFALLSADVPAETSSPFIGPTASYCTP